MNDVNIILPCGFSVKYKDILYKSDRIQCPGCKTHDITRQECLNMARNKLVLQEKSFELKKNHYVELMKQIENYKNDPKHYIDESFDSLRREVDLRREEVKAMIIQKIDDYHDGLMKKIDMERDLKLKELEEKIKKAESLDLASFKIDENLDINCKLESFRKSKIKIDNDISLVQNILDDLNEPKFKLSDCDDYIDIDIENLFGKLYSKGETIQLIINDFSQSFDKKKLRINSKKFVFRNFEWYISIKLNEKDGEMGFYLFCNSMEESSEFSVNVTTELSLLNKSNSKKDKSYKKEYLFTKNDQRWGYPKFTTMSELMNPLNGYYDVNEDSITLKAVLITNSE